MYLREKNNLSKDSAIPTTSEANKIVVYVETYLDCAKLLVDDLNHSFNFLGCDWSGTGLFSQQVHDVGCEFVASLLVLFHLLLVNCPTLGKLILVVGVLYGCTVLGQRLRRWCTALVRTCVKETSEKLVVSSAHGPLNMPGTNLAK